MRPRKRLTRQLETAKAEVTKPFAKETELKEKLDRLSALNALLNMDETGSDVQVENEVSEQSEADTFEHDDQRAGCGIFSACSYGKCRT